VRGSLLARLFLPRRRIKLCWALVFDKNSDSRSPAIAGVWVVVPSPSLWPTNGGNSLGRWWWRSWRSIIARMGGLIGVFLFLLFLQGVSSVFRGRRRWPEMKNDVVSRLGGRGRVSIWSSKFQQFLIGSLGRIAAPYIRWSLDLNNL
jgi:hypothetical protein